tara:strand:- start:9 stop:221 length:213 start_codon:yes stop_codon:yes gene_type:complete
VIAFYQRPETARHDSANRSSGGKTASLTRDGRAIADCKTLSLAATENIAGLEALETLSRLRRARCSRFSA